MPASTAETTRAAAPATRAGVRNVRIDSPILWCGRCDRHKLGSIYRRRDSFEDVRRARFVTPLLVGLILAACGGGGDDTAAVDTQATTTAAPAPATGRAG